MRAITRVLRRRDETCVFEPTQLLETQPERFCVLSKGLRSKKKVAETDWSIESKLVNIRLREKVSKRLRTSQVLIVTGGSVTDCRRRPRRSKTMRRRRRRRQRWRASTRQSCTRTRNTVRFPAPKFAFDRLSSEIHAVLLCFPLLLCHLLPLSLSFPQSEQLVPCHSRFCSSLPRVFCECGRSARTCAE